VAKNSQGLQGIFTEYSRGFRGPVILAIAIWEVAGGMRFVVNVFDVVDGFGVLTLTGLFFEDVTAHV